jgi:hypothetical protein
MANSFAWGFVDLDSLMDRRVSTVGVDIITRAVTDSAAQYTAQLDAMLALLAQRTTAAQVQYRIPGSGTLQPIGPDGNPLPVQVEGMYTVGFPIQGGATAYGTNRVTQELMTVAELNDHTLDAQVRDADWMRRHMLAALLDNTSWTFTDPLFGALTVQPLANNDTVLYPRTGGTAPAAAQHYLAQTAAIADATNPFDDLYALLRRYPSQSNSDVVAYVPTNVVSAVQGLTNFIAVSDVRVIEGANTARLTNNGAAFLGPGAQVLGLTDGVWVVEWPALPNNYVLAVATDADPVLAMREYESPALQGLFPEFHSPDGNHREFRFIRFAGFGVQNRIGAAVYQVSGGDTNYDIPTGYSTPLAA